MIKQKSLVSFSAMKKITLLTILSLVLSSGAMAAGDVARGKTKAAVCAACHGNDGNSVVKEWPKIAGQHSTYTLQQLLDFQKGQDSGRANPTMAGIIAGLSQQDMEDLAAFFETQSTTIGAAQEDLVAKGQALYQGGDAERKITACTTCHGPKGIGLKTAAFPKLSGQHPEYIIAQLKMFRSGERANDLNGMMRDTAKKLTDEEMVALASYINGLH